MKNSKRLVRSRTRGQMTQVQAIATGRRLNVAVDPVSINRAPWNTLITEISVIATTSATITANKILIALATQLGLAGNEALLNLRVRNVRAYASAADTGVVQPTVTLNADVYPITYTALPISDVPILMSLSDNGGQNHFAAVGYEWPLAMQAVPIDSTNTSPIVRFALGVDTPVLVRFDVLWRPKTA